MAVYGYLRVSSDKQTVENQKYEIETFCRINSLAVDNWVEETISGTVDFSFRKLGRLLRRAKISAKTVQFDGELITISSSPLVLNVTSEKKDNIWLIDEGEYQFLWYDCDGVSFDKGFQEITSGCYHNESMNDQSKLWLQDCSIGLYGEYVNRYEGQTATVYLYACNSSMDAIKYYGNVPYAIALDKCWSGNTTDSIGDCISTIKLNDAYGSAENFYVGIKVVFEDGHSYWVKLDEIPSGSTFPEWQYTKRLIDGVDCYMINLYDNTEVITNTYTGKTPVYDTETAYVYLYVDTKTNTVYYDAGVFADFVPAYTITDNLGFTYNIPGYLKPNQLYPLMVLYESDPAGTLSHHFYWERDVYGREHIVGCKEGNEIDSYGRIFLAAMGETEYWHATSHFYTPYIKEKEDAEHVYYKRYEVLVDR